MSEMDTLTGGVASGREITYISIGQFVSSNDAM